MGMRKIPLLTITVVIISIGLFCVIRYFIEHPPHACFLNKHPLLDKAVDIHQQNVDIVRYVGVIDCVNSQHLKTYLEHHGDGGQFASINSPGGVKKGADWMVDILEKHKKTVLVEDSAVCGSACVFVFIRNAGAVARPGALFFFHKGHSDDPKYEKLTDAMRDWARELSPRLADFLASCSVDPTTTDEGIFLYWHEITEIASGNSFDCDFIVSLNKVRGKEFDARL